MSTLAAHRGLLGVSAVLFVASAVVTVAWCGSMSAMAGMEMPGGWTMSMAWMRMPGQTWSGAAATFLAMWSVMMVAMMLPVLVPTLMRLQLAGYLTTAAGAGYFAGYTLPNESKAAFRLGLGLGILCVRCCLGLTTILLVIGVMDLRAMALCALAISAERLSRRGPHMARWTGGMVVAGSLWLLARV